MTQQINLYQPIFRKQRKVFSAVTIAQAAGLFVVGLLLIYGYGRWQVAALGADIAALELQRNAAMLQLQVLSARAAPARAARAGSRICHPAARTHPSSGSAGCDRPGRC